MAKIPDLSFKGVVITKKDFYSVIKVHFELGTDRAPRDWSNNEEFKRVRCGTSCPVAQCAEIVKSIFAVQSWLKPERFASSCQCPDNVVAVIHSHITNEM